MLHNEISDALAMSKNRPRRKLISFFLRKYAIILGVAITLIMLIAAFPYAPIWTTLWIAIYWSYFFARQRLRQRYIFGLPYHSRWIQFCRVTLLTVGVMIFLGYLYLYTDYLRNNQGQDTLWLFLLLATFIMSQYGITELLIFSVTLASMGLVVVQTWAAPEWSLPWTQNIIIKVLWLALFSFILHVLLRFIRDWYASVQLLHTVVGEEILQIQATPDENHLCNTIVDRIAADYDYPHVNLLCRHADGTIKYTAGACKSGRYMASRGYILQHSNGIIKHVIKTGRTHIANNVLTDRHYVKSPQFPKTKAEMAVPIILRGETIGVLDVQTHQTEVFFPQDKEVLETLAGHLAKALDNIILLRSRQHINKIVKSIAHRFLSQHELESTLDQIVKAAHEELKADVVLLYEHDPSTGKVMGPVPAGTLYAPEQSNLSTVEPDSLVHRLLADSEVTRFHEDIRDIPDASLFVPTEYHRRQAIPIFAEREKIKSRAVICLQTDTGRIGILFLNFRSPRKFEEQDKQMFFSFAHLATLAIQKAQFHQEELKSEREDLSRHLHDQLMATADGLDRIIATMFSDGHFPQKHQTKLELAQDAIKELKRDLKYLNETLKDTALANLPDEVEKMTARAENAYGVTFDVQWVGLGQHIPSALALQLKYILNEAIMNAIKHGKATRIDLTFGITDSEISMSICDNGRGFNTPSHTRSGGLTNIRERVEQKMSGVFTLESVPGKGAKLMLTVPRPISGGSNEHTQ